MGKLIKIQVMAQLKWPVSYFYLQTSLPFAKYHKFSVSIFLFALYSDGPFSNSYKFISQVTLFFLFDPINGSNWIVCFMHVIHIILRFKYFGIFTTSTCYSQYNIFVNLSKKCINFIGWTTENVWQLNSFGNIKMKQVYVVCKSLKKIQEEKTYLYHIHEYRYGNYRFHVVHRLIGPNHPLVDHFHHVHRMFGQISRFRVLVAHLLEYYMKLIHLKFTKWNEFC